LVVYTGCFVLLLSIVRLLVFYVHVFYTSIESVTLTALNNLVFSFHSIPDPIGPLGVPTSVYRPLSRAYVTYK